MMKFLAGQPTWNVKLACDDPAAAKALAKATPTYENLVNVQRLERAVKELVEEHRSTFREVPRIIP